MIIAVLALHAVLGIAIVAAGDRLGRRGFAVAAAAPAVTLVWLAARLDGVLDGAPIEQDVEWIPQLGLELSFRLDAFGAAMVALVSGIGLLVCLYAIAYFSHPKSGTGRLAGLLTLFAGAMLGVVLTDHLLTLFVCWELTSITSYLLIGNDDRDAAARQAALSAIIITGAGGLALLGGLVLVGQASGTYRISELIAVQPTGTTVSVGIVLILVGAFTKSAQLPFSGWLPGAMVAPTPISTYLHAATMVKAGVYLVARLAPAFADVGIWRPLVLVVGSATMIVGGWRAMRQFDLKLLLAYGTVSQLGFMMLLFGMGEYALSQAGVVLLLAHGAFKASLFMTVGIVDHQAGTRDVRALRGLGGGWRPVTIAAVVSAASMAGLPPLLGFIAKEKGLDAALHGEFGGATALVVVLVAGSVLTFAYSGRFVLGMLGRLGDPDFDPVPDHAPDHGDAHDDGHGASAASPVAPGWSFQWPAIALAVFTAIAGLAPVVVDRVVRAATIAIDDYASPKEVALWTGVNAALGLSAVIVALGAVLVVARRRVEVAQARFHRVVAWAPDADRSFSAIISGTTAGARQLTRIVQNGSLPIYLMVILGVAALAPLAPALGAVRGGIDLIGPLIHLPIAALIVGAAVGATVVHRRIAAALMLGAVGFAMAGFYVSQGAPDLALTQVAIETLATVLFVLVLRFLPRRFADVRSAVIAPVRIAVSVLVGASVFVLALVATASRDEVAEPSVSGEMIAKSVPEAKGANVVNVILVDFRGLDTLGEITVLVVAGLGVVALARTVWVFDRSVRSFARLPLVELSSRLLYPSILVLATYFLFAGHNQPGGGFVGGLTAGAAVSLRYVSGGVGAVRDAVRVPPWTVLAGGLVIAAGTALLLLLSGGSVLEHLAFERSLPLLGTVKSTTALPFDIGVFLVVVGLVLMAYEAFGDEADIDDRDRSGTPRADDGASRPPEQTAEVTA